MTLGTVLVVEDDEGAARAFRRALHAAGASVLVAHDRTTAAALLVKEMPDVVLADLMLHGDPGGIDVLEFAAVLTHAPALLAISAVSSVELGLHLGARSHRDVVFLPKPITSSELIEAVETAAERRSLQGAGPKGLPEVLAAERERLVQKALQMTGGNITKAAQVLRISRQNLQHFRNREQVTFPLFE